jgi:hypothetical protein
MRECAKGLGPDDSEVPNASHAEFGEDPVEDVTEQVEAQTGHHSLSTRVTEERARGQILPRMTDMDEFQLTVYRRRN